MKLDLTGGASDNRRTSVIPIDYKGGDIALLTPQNGFFHTSMSSPIVRHNGQTLKYGTDYRYAYKSKEIRDKYSISAHGSIVLTKLGLEGQIELEASYLGAQYRLYKTDYVSYISSTEYLLSLYDINSLIDLPDDLPPMASLLDMEKITSGMTAQVQIVYALGYYLKEYETGREKPTSGIWWPELEIKDREPPIEMSIKFNTINTDELFPADRRPLSRLGLTPMGSVPMGYNTTETKADETFELYPRVGIDARAGFMPMDYAVSAASWMYS